MAATVHVVARFLAKAGKEEALNKVLTVLVVPARRELDCYQFDLLENPAEPRDFCLVQRWGSEKALDRHLETPHVKSALTQVEGLLDAEPDIRRYRLV